MYKYELGTIIACESLSEEETQTIIGQIRELISECHGRIIKEDLWGQKELAYPIKKQNHGFYMFTLVNFESHEVPLFENKLRLLDGCLRYLLINLDKEPGYNEQQEIDSHKETTESVSTEQPIDTAEAATVEEETKPKPEKKTKTARKTTPKEKSAAPKEKPAKTIDSEESDKKDDVVSEEKPAEPAPKAEDKKAKAENLDKILDEIL